MESTPPAHYVLSLVESPAVTRFLLSNGVTIDMTSFSTDSHMRGLVVDWAKKEFKDKDVHIDGSTVLAAGTETAVVTVASLWVPPGEPELTKSSDTSTKRSKTTKGKTRVRHRPQ